jgi:Domain of unknown function (DUF3471)
MLRHLYRCALRLHPPEFRRRFGEEMLSIYDRSTGRFSSLRLLLDAVVSLARQWILRPEFWLQAPQSSAPQPAADGIPSFSSLDPFRPHTSAMIHGTLVSMTLFCVTCFAIRYSWIHVLHVQIPGVSYDRYLSIHPGASPGELRGRGSAVQEKEKPTANSQAESNLIAEHLQVDVLPVEAQAAVPDSPPANLNSQSITEPLSASVAPLHLSLESYVGTYVSHKPSAKIAVGIEGDHLTIRVVGRPKRALSPVSETTFVVAGTNDHWVEFVSDANGKMRQLRLFQEGESITALRQ